MVTEKDCLEVTVTVRRKNQVTVPETVMRRLGLQEGDRLRLHVDAERQTLIVEPLPRSYAGIAPGLYGTEEEVAAYIEGERAAWNSE